MTDDRTDSGAVVNAMGAMKVSGGGITGEATAELAPATAPTLASVVGRKAMPTSYVGVTQQQQHQAAMRPMMGMGSSMEAGGAPTAPGSSTSSVRVTPAEAVPVMATSGATVETPSVSLYVGDLHPDVVEQNLFELFSSVGPVVSVRVCRDVVTRRSLGYAYVNFQSQADAERAMDVLNFYEGPLTRDKPIRIMWKRSDPAARRNPEGNVFIKNLSKNVDNKALYDTFGTFGKILSCKITTNERGESLGYAFVHYQDPEVAKTVISKMNGMLLDGEKIFVGEFRSRREREAAGEVGTKFTNVYVKNLDETMCNEQELSKIFGAYGEITSMHIPVETFRGRRRKETNSTRSSGESSPDNNDAPANREVEKATSEAGSAHEAEEAEEVQVQTPRGFAFVNFANPNQAKAAVEALNGTEWKGKEIYVGRAQTKAERDAMLRVQMEQVRVERMQKTQDVNLFVKNLTEDVDEDKLREAFSRYGTITSLRIMRDDRGVSRGFGFVTFSQQDEAIKAVTELNQRIIGQKPIYVSLAQRKDQRRAQLEAQRAAFMRAQMNFGPPGMLPSMYHQVAAGNGASNTAMHPASFAYPYGMPPMQGPMAMGRGMPIYPGMPGAYTPMSVAGPGMAVPSGSNRQGNPAQVAMAMSGQAHAPYGIGTAQQPTGPSGTIIRTMPRQQRMSGRGGATMGMNGSANNAPYKLSGTARNVPVPAASTNATLNHQAVAQPLTVQMLANADPKQQKQMLGERLYPLVYQKLVREGKRELAPKITGMLLEMDNSEVLHLVESPESLREKVAEALDVLQQHLAALQST